MYNLCMSHLFVYDICVYYTISRAILFTRNKDYIHVINSRVQCNSTHVSGTVDAYRLFNHNMYYCHDMLRSHCIEQLQGRIDFLSNRPILNYNYFSTDDQHRQKGRAKCMLLQCQRLMKF